MTKARPGKIFEKGKTIVFLRSFPFGLLISPAVSVKLYQLGLLANRAFDAMASVETGG
jgi:hypothetical protein